MWGLGLIMLCLFAFVIIGVISNITLTNQQDYYGVKQTTEAGAYDSVDQVVYKRGISQNSICALPINGSAQFIITVFKSNVIQNNIIGRNK